MFKKQQPKSVELITAQLHNTVAELEGHADEQLEHAAAQSEAAANAAAQARYHRDEHERAVSVATNIKALLS